MEISEHPIFIESIEHIRSKIGFTGFDEVQQSILERIIHASGDLRIQSLLRFSPRACDDAIGALRKGAKILTDTRMAEVAVSSMAKRTLNSDVQCILDMRSKFADLTSTTRSAVAMRTAWLDLEKKDDLLEAPIVVIGSAPTALMTLLDLTEQGSKKPSLIIGMPVGFIGVSESKARLLNSDIPHIVLDSSKGGASLAAATMNALLKAAVSA